MAPTHPINAILFDFDGTLAPNLDLPDMRRQIIGLTREARVPETVYADNYIVEIIDTASAWLRQHDPRQAEAYHRQAHQFITDFEIRAAAATSPFPGIHEKLHELRNGGMRLGVVTRNCREAVLAVFPDLLEHVDALHARGDTTHLKPDPRHLQHSLDTLNVAAVNAAMVGDGALDMHAGRKLDMFCIGVLSGSSNTQRLLSAGAHQVLESCLELTL